MLEIYDKRHCLKRLYCLPIIQNARELPLTESWVGLACSAASYRTALLTSSAINVRLTSYAMDINIIGTCGGSGGSGGKLVKD
jgi:hypothetical protein